MNKKVRLNYWQALQQKMPVLLVISVGAAIIAYVIVRSLGPSYETHFSYLISLSDRDQTNTYRFDGYYALQATDLFSSTLAEWVQSPEVVVATYRQAGRQLPSDNPQSLRGIITATKAAPQLVQVTVTTKDKDETQKLTQALLTVMERNVAQYHEQGTPAVRFRVVNTEPWLGVSQLSQPVIVSATFVLALFFSTNIFLLWRSLKEMPKL
jgi:capsular polysaccharide biosynthesis protein